MTHLQQQSREQSQSVLAVSEQEAATQRSIRKLTEDLSKKFGQL